MQLYTEGIAAICIVILVLTNYALLLLYIFYEQSNLNMLVTMKALLVAITWAQIKVNRSRVYRVAVTTIISHIHFCPVVG